MKKPSFTPQILAYSARKNSVNPIPANSIWNPAISSVSASDKSKGALDVSAKQDINHRTQSKGNTTRFEIFCCCNTIWTKLNELVIIRMFHHIIPIETSYEIISKGILRAPYEPFGKCPNGSTVGRRAAVPTNAGSNPVSITSASAVDRLY